MSKNIFDEALKHLNILNDFVVPWCDEIDLEYHDTYYNNYQKVKKAIEQAQKQEKLLELYRYLDENANDYDLHPDEVDAIHNKIEELENEILQ